MKSDSTVLLVGGANQLGFRAAALRRGYRIVTINFPKAIELVERDDVIKHAEAVDFKAPLAVARRIVELHKRWHFDGIVAVVEYGLQSAAIAAHSLGLPSVSLKAVQNTRDKVRMRRVLEEAQLGQVRYRACQSLEAGEAFLREIGRPIIVKPLAGTGSDGVSLVANPSQLAEAFQLAATARAFGGILCEEFIPGPEVSVEGYSIDGEFVPVAITDKLTNARFLEIGHQQPTSQPVAVQQSLFAFTAKILHALDVENAVSHTELKITNDGPVLIETHTRLAGGGIPILTERTTGVDLADLMVALSLGEKPQVRPERSNTAAAVRFLVRGPGRVRSIDVPPLESGVESVTMLVRPGEVLTGRSASLDRPGYVIATGSSALAAAQRAEDFISRIILRLEDPAQPEIDPARSSSDVYQQLS